MKNLKRIGGLLCLATVIALVGCGGNNTPATTTPAQTTTTTTGATQTQKFTVTFNAQGGSAVQAQEVNAGQKATKPADPSKEGFEFDGWYKEAACENVFDFATETVSANVTVYAGWIDSSSATTKTAKFYWNYTGAPAEVYDTKTFKDGGRITNKPTDPTRTGYVFDGWYKEAACTNAFAPNAKYTGDQNFYARWLKAFTMEAEDTQLTGITPTIENQGVVSQSGDKLGSNFSGNVSGKNLIRADENSSGGKFVWGCMNLEEGYLDFEFTADKADDNAILELKVCAEFWGFVLTPETFKVLVNPEDNDDDSVDFGEIDLSFVQTSTQSTAHPAWVTKTVRVSLQEGSNLIRLLVANDNANSVGTIKAQGPIVDCIVVKSTAELTMTTYNNQ